METEGSCEYMEQAVGDSCKGALLQQAREPVYMYVCILSLCGGHGEGGTAHLGGEVTKYYTRDSELGMSEVDHVWNDKRVQDFGRKARREEQSI